MPNAAPRSEPGEAVAAQVVLGLAGADHAAQIIIICVIRLFVLQRARGKWEWRLESPTAVLWAI
jgi:hypothetical protein